MVQTSILRSRTNYSCVASGTLRYMSLTTDWGKRCKVLVLLCAQALLAPPVSQAQWRTSWEYERGKRAEHWSELDPDYIACNAGKEQSPIDIQHAVGAELPALRFEYKSGPLRYLVNNGHTIRVNYHDTPGAGNIFLVGGKRYQLTQFHIITSRGPVCVKHLHYIEETFHSVPCCGLPEGIRQHHGPDAISNTQHRCVIYDSAFIKQLISPGPGGY